MYQSKFPEFWVEWKAPVNSPHSKGRSIRHGFCTTAFSTQQSEGSYHCMDTNLLQSRVSHSRVLKNTFSRGRYSKFELRESIGYPSLSITFFSAFQEFDLRSGANTVQLLITTTSPQRKFLLVCPKGQSVYLFYPSMHAQ